VGREDVEATRVMVKAADERGVERKGSMNQTGRGAEFKCEPVWERDCNGA